MVLVLIFKLGKLLSLVLSFFHNHESFGVVSFFVL